MTASGFATVSQLELRTAYGPVYRTVLNTPPRDCRSDEIPIIDLSRIDSSSLEDRKAVAAEIRSASVNNGFFYIKNHGIPGETIQNARAQLLEFFHQPLEKKIQVHKSQYKGLNGYSPARTTLINKSSGIDERESFSWQYDPRYDPEPKSLDDIPAEVQLWLRADEGCWTGNSHLPQFKKHSLAYWSACLTLSRKLVRIFALALDLPENYFDSRTTYPGADGVYNYYPPATSSTPLNDTIGLGAHTDLQLFTLLYQDPHIPGLQILTKSGQWLNAPPIPDTLVVNIGDFLMRLSNDIFKSTVHRVTRNVSKTTERISMPFFFGLNFNCVEGVVPSCVKEGEEARYEPISCGEWCELRFKQERRDAGEKLKWMGDGRGG